MEALVIQGWTNGRWQVPRHLHHRSAIPAKPGNVHCITTTSCSDGRDGMRGILAGMLGIEPERLRVIVSDMGGGFGARGTPYPEFALILAAGAPE